MKIFVFLLCFNYSIGWSIDINCLINKCDEDNSKEQSSFNFNKYNPYCLAFNCENKVNTENVETYSKSNLNPYCWFKECSKLEQYPKFWKYNYWFNDKDLKTWKDKLYGIFKNQPKLQNQDNKSRFSIREMFSSAINYLNAAKPQEFVVNNMLSSELNPYCWFTECCNENTLPGNIEKLSDLLKTRVYGQHLTSILIGAIGSHWDSKHISKKALVLSFHGPVGTGKNYVSQLIANSLFKLGAKSIFVHHFSGKLHFTTQENSDSYKQNLYNWLKGNVTYCGKQLFIFNEAEHMSEQVLNSILPMLDYREKVDGADYRNSIFVFLSNSGSNLIVEKLDNLYHNNKTREQLEIEDFEKIIINNIFNEQGGFYHSDTISHNLIDHYIPFLPMERHHVIECIKDQFRERNVDSPSEKHIGSILNSISWRKAHNFEYSTSGCKVVVSKVSALYEKHYKLSNNKKSDL